MSVSASKPGRARQPTARWCGVQHCPCTSWPPCEQSALAVSKLTTEQRQPQGQGLPSISAGRYGSCSLMCKTDVRKSLGKLGKSSFDMAHDDIDLTPAQAAVSAKQPEFWQLLQQISPASDADHHTHRPASHVAYVCCCYCADIALTCI